MKIKNLLLTISLFLISLFLICSCSYREEKKVRKKINVPLKKSKIEDEDIKELDKKINENINWKVLKLLLSNYKLETNEEEKPYLDSLYPIYKDGMTGFIDKSGKKITECIFKDIFEVNGLLLGIIYTNIDEINMKMDIYLIDQTGVVEKIATEPFLFKKINVFSYDMGESYYIKTLHNIYRYEKFDFKNKTYSDISFLELPKNNKYLYFSFQVSEDKREYYAYDLKKKILNKSNIKEKILFFETNSRKFFVNPIGEYWMENLDGYVLSDMYDKFIPQIDSKTNKPQSYLFLKKLDYVFDKYYKDLTDILKIVLLNEDGEVIFENKGLFSNSVFGGPFGYYAQNYYDIVNSENLLTFEIRQRFDRYATSPHRSGYLEYEADDIITYAINKNNYFSKSSNSILTDVIYISEEDNLIIGKETKDLSNDNNYNTTKVFDMNFNFKLEFDVPLQYFIPLTKDNEKMYLAGDKEKFYILNKDLDIIENFNYEKDEKYDYVYIDNKTNNVIYQNYKSSSDKDNVLTYIGSAIYTLSTHDINIVNYLFCRGNGERILTNNHESEEFQNYYKKGVENCNNIYDIYFLDNKKHRFYSKNFIRFFNKDMIQIDDDVYYNLQGEKTWPHDTNK